MCYVRISIIAKWKKIWHLFNQFNYEQIYSNGLRRIQINLEIKNKGYVEKNQSRR